MDADRNAHDGRLLAGSHRRRALPSTAALRPLDQTGYRYTPLTTPVLRTRRITSARCLRSFTSSVNNNVAANGLRSVYSTFSMLEPDAAIAAATVASTPGRFTTSLRNCAL